MSCLCALDGSSNGDNPQSLGFKELGQISGPQPGMILSPREYLTYSGTQLLEVKDAAKHPINHSSAPYDKELRG